MVKLPHPLKITLIRTHWLATQIRRHRDALELGDRLEVVTADTFRRFAQLELDATRPWLVFVCPPYAMFTKQWNELRHLIETVLNDAPRQSTVVVEADEGFQMDQLPDSDRWTQRTYRPTVVAWCVT